jgi:hydrogenase maturation protease
LDAPSARTAVLGLGNPVLTDDAVGLRVVESLRALLEADPVPGADVLASTRAGFELIDMLQGYARAIIIDALEVPDPRPGRVRSLDLGSFAGSARLNSAHEIDVATAFELARTLGIPMPGSVEIFAVEAKEVRTLSESLTPEVEASVEPLAREIHALLKSRAEGSACQDGGAPRRPFYEP